jgi:hypothetical protein
MGGTENKNKKMKHPQIQNMFTKYFRKWLEDDSATILMKSAVFWAVTQHWNVAGSQRFMSSCWSHLHRLKYQRRMPSNRSESGHTGTGVDGDRFLATRTKVNRIWSLHLRRKDSEVRSLLTYLIMYSLHGAETFLRS